MNADNEKAETSSGQTEEVVNDKTNLIINYIPQFATEADIAPIFKQIGNVQHIKIVRNRYTDYSYGYGFVKYYSPEEAAKAIEIINGMAYGNKRLKVSYSRPPGANMQNSNLYIRNLPKHFTEDDLDRVFGKYGEIIQRNVLRNKISGVPRGIAFVRYSKEEEAQIAINHLDGKMFENAEQPLIVCVAVDFGRQRSGQVESWRTPMAGREPLPFGEMMMPRNISINTDGREYQNWRTDSFGNVRDMTDHYGFLSKVHF